MSISRSQYQSYAGSKRQSTPAQPSRSNSTPPLLQPSTTPTPPMTNHEEVVRFVHDSWVRATREDPTDPDSRVTYYQEKEPNPQLKDFKPVDLEAFCQSRRAERSSQNSS